MSSVVAQVFSRTSLAHAISGCAGGTIAMLLVYPLDQLRLHAQLAAVARDDGKTQAGVAYAPPAGTGMLGRAIWIIQHRGFFELYVSADCSFGLDALI